MIWGKKNKKSWRIPCFVLIGFFSAQSIGIMINISPSVPMGIYIKKSTTDIKRGDIVAVCLNSFYTHYGLQRLYLKSPGQCNGAMPLIKQVLAIPGDHVKLLDDYILVNRKRYAYRTFYHDHQGKSLRVFPRGEYVSAHDYWLFGINNSHSWDSRYWGPIPRQKIITVLNSLFIWG